MKQEDLKKRSTNKKAVNTAMRPTTNPLGKCVGGEGVCVRLFSCTVHVVTLYDNVIDNLL